jgi:hypothetical protein
VDAISVNRVEKIRKWSILEAFIFEKSEDAVGGGWK